MVMSEESVAGPKLVTKLLHPNRSEWPPSAGEEGDITCAHGNTYARGNSSPFRHASAEAYPLACVGRVR